MPDKSSLNEDQKSRIHLLKIDHWIGYDRAIEVRDRMEALFDHPRTQRMPSLAIIGNTNNGKTMVLRSFLKRHEVNEDPNAEKTEVPVLYMLTPPTADERRLYHGLLNLVSAAGAIREPEESKLHRLKDMLRRLNTRTILLDDFFNAGSGSPLKRRIFLNALRNLSNDLEMPLIISGTAETLNALSIDASIANRFNPVFLPKWDQSRLEEFARFIVSIEKFLYLKSGCQLLEERVLVKLLILSEGLLGEVVAILRLLAEQAIKDGSETIAERKLNKENLKKLGWVMPSDRSRRE